MKKFYFLFLLAFIFVSQIFAQQKINSGSFQFVFNDTKDKKIEKIKLEAVQKIEETNTSNILILNLIPGEYKLTVQYKFYTASQTATQNIKIESDKRIICSLNENNLLSFSYKNDESAIPLNYDVNAANDLFNNIANNIFDIAKEDQNLNNNNSNNQGNNNNHNNNSNNNNHNNNNHNNNNHNSNNKGNNNNNNNNHHNNNGNGNAQITVVKTAISDLDFNNLYNSAKSEKFASDQIKSIQTASDYHEYFTSEQVKKLASIPTQESDKLIIAKYLAPKVIDNQNLPYIKDIFKFSSTKDEYLNYIKTIKQ